MAEMFPLPSVALTVVAIILAVGAFVLVCRPRLLATYAMVGAGFFLLHNLENSNTEGQHLADQLGSRPRVVTAIGCVISEPKTAPSGFATFLLKLKSIELEGRNQSAHAVWQVRWKGAPEFGDELKFFGTAEQIPPPRNPGEFDMRSYLARRRCPSDALRSVSGGRHANSTRRWQPDSARGAKVTGVDAKHTLPRAGGRA